MNTELSFIELPVRLLLVQTSEGSIHSLVEAPTLRHRDVQLICCLQRQVAGFDRTSAHPSDIAANVAYNGHNYKSYNSHIAVIFVTYFRIKHRNIRTPSKYSRKRMF